MEPEKLPDFDLFLSHFPPQVAALAASTRRLILEVIPGMVEQLDEPANLVGYGSDRTYKGLICGILLYKTYLNLMFARGAALPDPDGLLKGTGKRARHIRIEREEDLLHPGVRRLLQAALLAHGAQQ